MSAAVEKSRRPFVIAAIMLATFMVAIEATIVATAMPGIVGQLGGFAYYSWVFAAFLLAQSTTTVIYGKLSDIFGRKPVLIAGLLLFLAGSLLCGFAGTMAWLILFRVIQGLGAGSIQPITTTIIGDLYKMEERGRVQGLIAGVWAVSSVVGPLAGGIIVSHLPWAWIFWINLPIGILTIAGLALFHSEAVEPRKARIDYPGAILFSIATISLMAILTETDADLRLLGGLGIACVVSAALFLWQERRAPEPLVSIQLWAQRLIATSNLATLFSGAVMIGLTTVLPIYVQGVMGRSAIAAGLTLSMLVLGWPLTVMVSNRLYRLLGIRRALRLGSVLLPLGAAFLVFLSPHSSPAWAGAGSFLIGCGMGMVSITSIVLIQDSVEWSVRGSATASILFARSLGSTVGATLLGTVLNIGVAHYGSGALAASVHSLLDRPTGLAQLAGDPAVRAVFDHALHWCFIGVVTLSVLAAGATFLIPIAHERRPVATAGTETEALEEV